MQTNLVTLAEVKRNPGVDYIFSESVDGVPMYRRVMSDEKDLHQSALEEWLGVLAQLWTAYDKPIEPERLQIYRKQFSILPMGLLEQAVNRAIRDHTFNSVPTPGELWFAVRKVLMSPSDLDAAIARWSDSVPDGIFQLHEAEGA